MYKTQADSVRDWLKAYQQNEIFIDQQLEKIRELKSRMVSISAQEITDMPRAPSSPKDKLSEYVIRLESMENQVKRAIKIQNESRVALIESISRIPDKNMQKIIRCRYLYRYEWSEIVSIIYKSEKDLSVKIKSYTRRIYRDHDKALAEMAKTWMPIRKVCEDVQDIEKVNDP